MIASGIVMAAGPFALQSKAGPVTPKFSTFAVQSSGAPDSPGRIAIPTSSATSANLTWSSVSGAGSYRIERAAGDSSFTALSTVTSSDTTYLDAGLTTGVSYRYRVVALSETGAASGPSPVASFTPQTATTIAAPLNLAAAQTAPSKVTISWTGPTSSQAVLIQRSTDGGMSWSDLVSLPGNTGTYGDTTVQRATLYAYRLKASTFTASSVFTGSAALITAPPDVTALTRTGVSQTTAELTWTASLGATGYSIEQSKEGGAFIPVASVGGGVVSTTISGLEPGTVYQYRIAATNSGGSSSTTTVNGVLTIPAVPTGLTSELAAGPTIEITFDGVKGAASYVIERMSIGRPWAKLVEIPASSDPTASVHYTDILVNPGDTFQYRVKAVNESGESQFSSTSSNDVEVEGAIPTPANVEATVNAKGIATIEWTSGSGADTYYVQRIMGKNWKTVATTLTTSATVKGIPSGTSARIRVIGVQSGTMGKPSDEIIAVAPPAAIKGLKQLKTASTKSIALTWLATGGSTKFTLERSTDKVTWETVVEDAEVAGLVDTDIEPGLTYSYRVSGGNEGGYGPPSASLTVLTAPAAPSGVTATQVDKAYQVTWEDVSGETGYRLQASADGQAWSNVGNAKANATNALVKKPNLKYFRLQSFNKAGSSGYSTPAHLPVTTTESKLVSKPSFSKILLSLEDDDKNQWL